MRWQWLGLVLAVSSCGRGGAATREQPGDPPRDADAQTLACEPLPFAEDLPIAEASGAAWIEGEDGGQLLVVGDSGTDGAYLLIDPADGEVLEHGSLPLGKGAGDDLEGIATGNGVIWGVTSAGWMRSWTRHGDRFKLDDGPYPVGPVDESLRAVPALGGLGAEPTASLACSAHGVNCGKNYEGLCLAWSDEPGACVGLLASKTEGSLWCLVRAGDRLVADPTRSIAVADPGVLADCAIHPGTDVVWVGANGFDDGVVYQVRGWRDPATAKVTRLGPLGDGFPEAMTVHDDLLYRFSDTSSAPSLANRYRCR